MRKKTLWGNGAADKQPKPQGGLQPNVSTRVDARAQLETVGEDTQVAVAVLSQGGTNRPGRVQGTCTKPAQTPGVPPASPASVPEDTPTVPLEQPTMANDWRWADCDWRFVIKNQSWGTILLILLPIILALAAMFTVEPTKEPFVIDDPTISRPSKAASIP